MKFVSILGASAALMMLGQECFAQSLSPLVIRTVQAESGAEFSGITLEGNRVSGADGGDYIRFDNVNFGTGIDSMYLRYAKADTSVSGFELRLDSLDGPILAEGVTDRTSGSWNAMRNRRFPTFNATGNGNTVFLRFTGGATGNIDRIQFNRNQRAVFQAENADEINGGTPSTNGKVIFVEGGDNHFRYDNVKQGTGYTNLLVRYAKGNGGSANLTAHIGSENAPAVATVQLPDTGSYSAFRNRSASFPVLSGTETVYFKVGGDQDADIDWLLLRNRPLSTEIDAGDRNQQSNTGTFNRGDGSLNVDIQSAPAWLKYNQVSLSYRPTIRLRYALGAGADVDVEIRNGGPTGKLYATASLPSTGGFNTYEDFDISLDNDPQGIRNLVVVFKERGEGNIESVTILGQTELPTTSGHLYGFNAFGEPFCSPSYNGSDINGYGWEDTDNDGQPNSCVIQEGSGPGLNLDEIVHFGEPLKLVGANLAWSDDNLYSRDFGRSALNIDGFRSQLDDIESAGGNSARIWLHTTSQTTPVVQPNGTVSGLSRVISNAQVVDQLEDVLDEAWSRGIVVTFSLFSFDMVCDFYGNDFGYSGVSQLQRHRTMIETEYQSYIDNALLPMVTGLKDHPGLLAWEVFNEIEGSIQGMTGPGNFCPQQNLTYPISLSGAQRFINRVAAAIHSVDPNVKVTTSTHTNYYNDFSNSTLTSQVGADPLGTLDFYELHWYTDFDNRPYQTNANIYNSDVPIIIGEYSLDEVPGGTNPDTTLTQTLNRGYAGAWPWSLTSANVSGIQAAIADVPAATKSLNSSAIEACILNKPSSCYNP